MTSDSAGSVPPASPVADNKTLDDCRGQKSTANLPSRIGDFEVERELGRGGMGIVYQARQTNLQRTVAIKMVLLGPHADENDLSRFRREVEALASLQHPHIVQIHEVGVEEGRPYCSLEYCAGGNLEQRLSGNPLAPVVAARLLETLARAIHHAHQQGIIHRDLKPANILFSADGSPKVGDFGLAKVVEQGRSASGDPTQSGAILGSPSYMAPEQAAGQSKDCDVTTDVYALGAILYETLTGRPPFKAPTLLETLSQVVSQEVVAPRELQPAIPHDLETICLKCLQKNGKQRYGSALALADDLGRYLAGLTIQARPVGRLETCWRLCRRNPAIASMAAALILVLMAATCVSTYFAIQARTALREKEEADQRYQEILTTLAAWNKAHPEHGALKTKEDWDQFFKANPSFKRREVRRAVEKQQADGWATAEAGTGAQGSYDPQMIGD